MKRKQAIEIIEYLYPADAASDETARTGRELLEQAKREVEGWRTLPTPILIRYAELCQERERREARRPGRFG